MATQQNAALPRRDGRDGRGSGALEPEVQQQVAELNLGGVDALRAALAAAGVSPGETALAAPGQARVRGSVAGPQRRAGRPARPAGAASGAAAVAPGEAPVARRPRLPAALAQLGGEWLALESAACLRLAAAPYLLFELDVAGLLRAAPAPQAVQEARPDEGSSGIGPPPLAGAAGQAFARVQFLFAWHVVRTAPIPAGMVLGLAPEALRQLRAVGLSCADAFAAQAWAFTRLRWEQQPAVWAAWLAAARGGDPAALWTCQLRGLQRIAGGCRDAAAPG